jgi:hypothetical protein
LPLPRRSHRRRPAANTAGPAPEQSGGKLLGNGLPDPHDPTRNINPFYVVDITPTLYGEWAVLRVMGPPRLTLMASRRSIRHKAGSG